MICTFTLCKETNCGKFISVYQHYRVVICTTTCWPRHKRQSKDKNKNKTKTRQRQKQRQDKKTRQDNS